MTRRQGSSIAGRAAAPWATDWDRKGGGRRLRVTDLPAFHRVFGGGRFDATRRAAA